MAALLSCAACFSPSPSESSDTDGSTGEPTADVGTAVTEGDEASTSGASGSAESASDGASGEAEGSDTTGGLLCTPGVFDRSMFGQACFQ